MDWWETKDLLAMELGFEIETDIDESVRKEGADSECIRVTCVPAQHNSGEPLLQFKALARGRLRFT